MGLSTNAVASLRNVILVFIAHTFTNAILLSPWNPLRCAYWTQAECTNDEAWICNWLAFAHLHVSVLLGCFMMVKVEEAELIERVAYLCFAIIMSYIMQGIFTIDLLDPLLAVIQCVVHVGILVAIFSITFENPNSAQAYMVAPARPRLRKMNSNSSFDQRQKLPIATIALVMHLISSVVRVIDMTFGNGRAGYTGDMSSPVFQSISSMAVCDMTLAAFLLIFALRFCTTEQHKLVLAGQAVILFISQIMLATSQGDHMDADMALAGSIGTFVFIVIAIMGAL
mmetsp:Transcript_4122/g.6889  ORF Transcript_4122/g.6889 Transcript_4122/m.6889 type:complete len:283 (+) Transcript_4122:1-849(+)|eukprot:CAMPEP_0119008274 /NCGR_PEP_ID=MMETSP1176-20130426/3584_1 /TAXON_ID=265551 /ORGANISM="Synedropsis recta cf, Strain CCMP1620" /LENGTH=282 /DNA_ID=CAMNT_0006960579 /DNA_START=1 /DNA_END=849 /DNA_ORIENTATION=-